MYVIRDEYNFVEVSWVADPLDKNALVKLSFWEKVTMCIFCTLLSVRNWFNRKSRGSWTS
jgi:hypothetical protein